MEIRIFHDRSRQEEGIHWIILWKGALFQVGSWISDIPVHSMQDGSDILYHQNYRNGVVPLPQFHLKTSGELDIQGLHAHITNPSNTQR